jgi:hypothetical protein
MAVEAQDEQTVERQLTTLRRALMELAARQNDLDARLANLTREVYTLKNQNEHKAAVA